MNLITPENATHNVFADGYVVKYETVVTKGSAEKITVEFDLSQTDAGRIARSACKDFLTDVRNNANADVKRHAEKGETVSFKEAVAARTLYDEARDVYVVRVKDLWARVRMAPTQKPISKQAETMTPEQLMDTIAKLQALLAAKQS